MFNTHQSRIDQQAAMLAALPAAKAAVATRESEPQINLPELIRKANVDHAAHLKNNAELTQKRRIVLTEKCASA